jgi:hypothetical protein
MATVPLFQPFRALGYITDNVPFATQRLGRETFVTVSVGKAWQVLATDLHTSPGHVASRAPLQASSLIHATTLAQVYNCNKLRLVIVGPQVPMLPRPCMMLQVPISV